MEQYIEKSAVVAEIVRKMNRCKKILLDLRTRQNKDYYQGRREAYIDILSTIDTLEVKDDMDTIHPIDDVVSNDTLANSLEISRHGNSHNGNKDRDRAIVIPDHSINAEVGKIIMENVKSVMDMNTANKITLTTILKAE